MVELEDITLSAMKESVQSCARPDVIRDMEKIWSRPKLCAQTRIGAVAMTAEVATRSGASADDLETTY
jgi:hypothetical protein